MPPSGPDRASARPRRGFTAIGPGVSGRSCRPSGGATPEGAYFRGGRRDQQIRARGHRPSRRFRLAGGRGDRAACQQGLSRQDRLPVVRRARREPVRLEEGRRAAGGREGAAPRGGRAGRGRARRRDRVLRCRRLSAAHDARDARPHGRHLSRAAAVLRAVARAGGSLQLRSSRRRRISPRRRASSPRRPATSRTRRGPTARRPCSCSSRTSPSSATSSRT